MAASAAAKKPQKRATRSTTARTTEGNVLTPAAWGMAQRTQELVDVLGGVSALARILGVSPSQPSRWRSGKEQPGPEMAQRLIDLDHVVARAGLLWHPKTVRIWLASANGHLNGATPMGVLATRGSSEVLRALDATEQGAFA